MDESKKIYKKLKENGLSSEMDKMIQGELELMENSEFRIQNSEFKSLYSMNDFNVLPGYSEPKPSLASSLKTLDDLLQQDNQREKDGFPRRIRLGKLLKPSKDNKGQIIIVPTTTEPKFYHDDSITTDEEETGGSGDGEEGDVIGEQQAQPEQGEGEGQGAGKGSGGEHDLTQKAYDLGKVLTEKFKLPNLKEKGKKRSFSKFTYDLTDRNRGFGQLLEKKETMKKVIETNIMLGNISEEGDYNPEDLLIAPEDHVYRILSREKDFESQAVVFFLRDYSGSMQGRPSEVISTQHLFIYSWLMYQYQNNVVSRFILHDTEAKEVPDFYTYYSSNVAGGTRIAPAFELVNKIVTEEQLAKDYNIYVFHGTDGDDWDERGEEMIPEVKKMLYYVSRIGITVARNSWAAQTETVVEKYMNDSGLLTEKPQLIRLDALPSDNSNEDRIIEGIKKLIG
jgi:uncharacterized protein